MRRIAGLVLAVACSSLHSTAAAGWHIADGDVEFGVTAVVQGAIVQTPSVLDTGYDGAWIVGGPIYLAVAQTFSVPSDRLLRSAELRVAGFNYEPASGLFEIAVHQFDSGTGSPQTILASVTADAAAYRYDIFEAPVSSFDFSSAGALLQAGQTYALVVSATPTLTNAITLQATGAYAGGSAYVSLVPEPGTAWLSGAGAGALLLGFIARRRRKFSTALETQVTYGRQGQSMLR